MLATLLFVSFAVCLCSAFSPCCHADGSCSIQVANASCGACPASPVRCRWRLQPFVQQGILLRPVSGPRITLSAQPVLQHSTHAHLPSADVWGFNGTLPGPLLVLARGSAESGEVSIRWCNELPHRMPLSDDWRHRSSWGNWTRFVPHLHGLHTAAPRFDGQPDEVFGPGECRDYRYRIPERGMTGTYHDHAMHVARYNVFLGLFGVFVVGELGEYDMPLIITDVSFDTAGKPFFPQRVIHMYLGDVMVVNGIATPFYQVERRVYRLRLLNLCTSRVLSISFPQNVTLIASDSGVFDKFFQVSSVDLGSGERAEVLIDFSQGDNDIVNLYHKRDALKEYMAMVQFRRKPERQAISSVVVSPMPAENLGSQPLQTTRVFNFSLIPSKFSGLIPWWSINGKHYEDVTEVVRRGAVEKWVFRNPERGMPHPVHLHCARFVVAARCALGEWNYTTGCPAATQKVLVRPEEYGLKDTVTVLPGEAVEVVVYFNCPVGRYVFHCHDGAHADFSMMRVFLVVNSRDACNKNGVCEVGEDCITCSADCPIVSGARCGNGICEIGDGEDCLSCAADCPSAKGLCCGRNVSCWSATSPLSCGKCRSSPSLPACAGDSLCEGAENELTTPIDCGAKSQWWLEPSIPQSLDAPILLVNYTFSSVVVLPQRTRPEVWISIIVAIGSVILCVGSIIAIRKFSR
jgi:spore coat protein A